MNRKSYIVLFLFLLCFAFGAHAGLFSSDEREDPRLWYTYDSRTELCFVASATYMGWAVYSNVPCNDKVRKLAR
jgi:hypothetical protein